MKSRYVLLFSFFIFYLLISACAVRKNNIPGAEHETMMRSAMEAYSQGDCRRSVDLFTALAASSPHPAILNGLGMAEMQCNQNMRAIETFKRALALAPGSDAIRTNLGSAYFAAGNLRSANNEFETVLKSDPSNPEAILGKASVYLERNEADKALQMLKQLPPDVQQTPEALFDRGLILYRLGLYDDAENTLRQCLNINGGDAGIYNALAISLLGLDKNKEALEAIDKAIAAEPMEGRYYYNRGNIHKAMKDFNKAIEDYGRAIAYEPQMAEAFVNRGDLLFLQNKQSQACADLEQACDLGLCERLENFKSMGRCLTGIWK